MKGTQLMRKRPLLLAVVAVLVTATTILAGCGSNSNSNESSKAGTVSDSVPFDRAFIDAMVPHHRSAIEMAKVAQQSGLASPELNGIALSIIDSQQQEIDQMLAWRTKWFGSKTIDPNAGDELGMSAADMGMNHNMKDLQGRNIDGMFASMMIDHHEGAIRMAQMALEQGQHPEIETLARQIIAAQEREITIMKPLAGTGSHDTMTGMDMG
jgi:uncharacterized protein (DUF305 family)